MSQYFASHMRRSVIYDSLLRDFQKAKSSVESVSRSESEHRAKYLSISHDLNTKEEECRKLKDEVKDRESKLADKDVQILDLGGENSRLREELEHHKRTVEVAKRTSKISNSFAEFTKYWGDISKAVDRAKIKEVHPECDLSFLGELQLTQPTIEEEGEEESSDEEESEGKDGADAEKEEGADGKTGESHQGKVYDPLCFYC